MAQQALGPGTAVPRRRALFGLLDADGWGWATVKAFVWLIIIIFILGYLPDRAYYLTVGRTVDLGVLVWSPINLCPPTNETLPCPAPGRRGHPVGAIADRSWPCRRRGPTGRPSRWARRSCTSAAATARRRPTRSTSPGRSGPGTSTAGPRAPSCPPPRANASVVSVAGSIYVIGGADAANAPTDTVFVLSPNALTGALGDWTTSDVLKLPEARAGAAAAVTPDGLLLVGGRNAAGPVATTWKTLLNNTGKLERLVRGAAAGHAADRRDGRAHRRLPVAVRRQRRERTGRCRPAWRVRPGGGRGPAGQPQPGQAHPLGHQQPGQPAGRPDQRVGLGRQRGASTWPAATTAAVPRTRCTGRSRPTPATSPSGSTSTPWTCPRPVSRAPPAVINGPNVVLVGGVTAPNTVLTSSVRANTAPLSPFFQLGLVGATVPGMKIEGEIGQQLGYLNAAGVGTVDFIILILIGWAFAHKAQARAIIGRVLHRGRRG